MKLSKPVNRDDALATLRAWAKELSSEVDGMTTLHHELISSLLGLRSQANREGWAHWPGPYPEMIELLECHFLRGISSRRVRDDLAAVCAAGEGTGRAGHCAYEELDRLLGDMVAWCLERPEWIPLPKGYDFWLDVPSDAVSPDAGSPRSLFARLADALRRSR